MYGYLKETTPLTLQLNLKHAPNIHNYSTRQAKTIRIPRHRLRSTSSSVSVKGAEVRNTILNSIKALPCIKQFSLALRN